MKFYLLHFNTPATALFREYGYEYRDGDYFDCLSSSPFKTLGTVHREGVE